MSRRFSFDLIIVLFNLQKKSEAFRNVPSLWLTLNENGKKHLQGAGVEDTTEEESRPRQAGDTEGFFFFLNHQILISFFYAAKLCGLIYANVSGFRTQSFERVLWPSRVLTPAGHVQNTSGRKLTGCVGVWNLLRPSGPNFQTKIQILISSGYTVPEPVPAPSLRMSLVTLLIPGCCERFLGTLCCSAGVNRWPLGLCCWGWGGPCSAGSHGANSSKVRRPRKSKQEKKINGV